MTSSTRIISKESNDLSKSGKMKVMSREVDGAIVQGRHKLTTKVVTSSGGDGGGGDVTITRLTSTTMTGPDSTLIENISYSSAQTWKLFDGSDGTYAIDSSAASLTNGQPTYVFKYKLSNTQTITSVKVFASSSISGYSCVSIRLYIDNSTEAFLNVPIDYDIMNELDVTSENNIGQNIRIELQGFNAYVAANTIELYGY